MFGTSSFAAAVGNDGQQNLSRWHQGDGIDSWCFEQSHKYHYRHTTRSLEKRQRLSDRARPAVVIPRRVSFVLTIHSQRRFLTFLTKFRCVKYYYGQSFCKTCTFQTVRRCSKINIPNHGRTVKTYVDRQPVSRILFTFMKTKSFSGRMIVFHGSLSKPTHSKRTIMHEIAKCFARGHRGVGSPFILVSR